MMRLLVLLIFVFVCFNSIKSQDLYMSRDVKEAYKKETRSPNGLPGKNYWQNHGRYNITLSVAPPSRTIYGIEEITYFNESSDTLKSLVFKCFLNIHKPTAVRKYPTTTDYLTSGVHIDSIAINNKAGVWTEGPYLNTSVPVALAKGLAPKDSVQVFIKWHFDVSIRSGREGMIDSTTFFLAYFFPRVAVYDDYQGWDVSEFNDALEFYNDFNDYTLHVQVPANYIVWATGTLKNPSVVLQPSNAEKLRASMNTDELVHVTTKQDILAKNVTAQNKINDWVFTAHNIPDVALGLSNHYVWDASSVVVDSVTKRRASVQAAYNDTAKDFHYMVGFARKSLSWHSFNWPGIPYPYEKTTIFQGYAGMEYPMMANDETYEDTTFSKFVAAHEIVHTYMPFYMGINETRYGFMDEGWATAFEFLAGMADRGQEKAEDFFKQFRVNYWAADPSADEDLPIITPGHNLSGGGLGNNQYGKPALGYLAIKDVLGDAMFKTCLHEYMSRWNGKHPIPWDFFNTFNNVSGKNLNWFWTNWFFSNNYIDLSIQSAEKSGKGYSIVIENIGGMAAPFDIVVTYKDRNSENIHYTSEIWEANQKLVKLKVNTKKDVVSIKLENGIFVDSDMKNNVWNNK